MYVHMGNVPTLQRSFGIFSKLAQFDNWNETCEYGVRNIGIVPNSSYNTCE